MRPPTRALIQALRDTAARLSAGARYQWTHQGLCNCGHLASALTDLSPAELHRLALQKAGDWSEKVIDHCPTSGFPIDDVIATMLEAGLTRDDIRHLEHVSDPAVLAQLHGGPRPLHRNAREDVVAYMRAFASLLEARRGEHHAAAETVRPDRHAA
ncbi:MAG: hypothetical protein EA398_05340 [Deltaproteobacteria bacterium]|nr:MAG: hypothetical protein EA398_05340 [Deltaproteobacteria bacterium]